MSIVVAIKATLEARVCALCAFQQIQDPWWKRGVGHIIIPFASGYCFTSKQLDMSSQRQHEEHSPRNLTVIVRVGILEVTESVIIRIIASFNRVGYA